MTFLSVRWCGKLFSLGYSLCLLAQCPSRFSIPYFSFYSICPTHSEVPTVSWIHHGSLTLSVWPYHLEDFLFCSPTRGLNSVLSYCCVWHPINNCWMKCLITKTKMAHSWWPVKNGRKFSHMSLIPVQSIHRVQLFATPWTTARQASLSITNSQSSPKPMSIESVVPSNHLILCHPLLLLLSIFPSIRVFKWVISLHQVAKILEFQLQASVLPMNIHMQLNYLLWVFH